ncbi:MAG: 3-isopropylmalate dehydratase small subunit [Acidimicrobiales bacterium]
MQALRQLTARGLPLRRSDVDTDQIIPSDWLKRIERTGFGAGLFAEWREDPTFVLNDERFKGAKFLVAGPNFGTGSSREHAVWALEDYGFIAVISARFGDIFRNNCTKVGVLPITLDESDVEAIQDAIEKDPSTTISLDVETREVVCEAAGVRASFPLDDFTQHRFLEGLDDIGLTLRHESDITKFEQDRPSWMPSTRV